MKEKKAKNEWKVIPISELPEGLPVLAVTEFASKKLAEFHLTEFVIFPLDGVFPKIMNIKKSKAANL